MSTGVKAKGDYVKSIVVLTCICLVTALLLAAVNYVTAPVIEKNQSLAANQSLFEVLPDAQDFETIQLPEGSPETVTGVYRDTAGTGYAVTLTTSTQYSSSDMLITMGVGADGKILNIVLTNYAESKDMGTDTYPLTYIGADSALSGIDTVAGVTYSSTAFKNAVSDGFEVLLQVAAISAGEKTDEQKAQEIAAAVFPYACSKSGECVLAASEEVPQGLSALYAAENGTGYIAVCKSGEETIFLVFDAFANPIAAYDGEETEQSADDYTEEFDAAAAHVQELVSEKTSAIVTRIEKMIDGASVTPISVPVRSSVSSAYKVETPDASYTAVVAAPYGYGGPVEILYILSDSGEIVRFKVISHNETEYFGEAVAETGYAEKQEGSNIENADDDAILIAGCTFTTDAVRQAYTDAAEAFEAIMTATE